MAKKSKKAPKVRRCQVTLVFEQTIDQQALENLQAMYSGGKLKTDPEDNLKRALGEAVTNSLPDMGDRLPRVKKVKLKKVKQKKDKHKSNGTN